MAEHKSEPRIEYRRGSVAALKTRPSRDDLAHGTNREHRGSDGPAVRGQDRGSWIGRSGEGRLRGVLTHGVADTGIPSPARAGTARQGSRPEGSGPMSGVWCSSPCSRVDQMGT